MPHQKKNLNEITRNGAETGQMLKKSKNFEKIWSSKVEIRRNRWRIYGCEVCEGDFRKDIWVSILVSILYRYQFSSILPITTTLVTSLHMIQYRAAGLSFPLFYTSHRYRNNWSDQMLALCEKLLSSSSFNSYLDNMFSEVAY